MSSTTRIRPVILLRSWRSFGGQVLQRRGGGPVLRSTKCEAGSCQRLRPPRGFEVLADGFEEVGHRDRLGDVGRAAAGADALLVAFHGEGGDRDDRNVSQGVVVLQPLVTSS